MCVHCACTSCTDLRRECSLIMEQCLTERLLLTLVDVRKPQHLFFVGCREVQEGLIAWEKGLVLPCDQQHAVPTNHAQSIHLLLQPNSTTYQFTVINTFQVHNSIPVTIGLAHFSFLRCQILIHKRSISVRYYV